MSSEQVLQTTEIGKFPQSWDIVTFRDILTENTRNGIYKKKEFHGRGIKIVNMGELFEYDFISSQDMKLIELNESEKNRFLLQKGDLLFARRSLVASGAGKCSIVIDDIDEMTFESSMIRARIDQSKANSLFIFYLFSSPLGKYLRDTILRHVAVAGITGTDLMKLKIPLPTLEEQNKIADYLHTIDSQIEINQNISLTIEKIGKQLFKHWFIDFEFPNVEGKPYKSSGGELVDSELGKIPKEWKVTKIKDFCDTYLGGTPSTKIKRYWENGTIEWISSGEINNPRIIQGSKRITEEALNNSATKMMPQRTVLIAITGATMGKLSIQEIDACANQSVVGMFSKNHVSQGYIYYYLQNYMGRLTSNATGSAHQHINKENAENFKILIPSERVSKLFKEQIDYALDMTKISLFENQKLSKTRDLLLPKLMSGEIRV